MFQEITNYLNNVNSIKNNTLDKTKKELNELSQHHEQILEIMKGQLNIIAQRDMMMSRLTFQKITIEKELENIRSILAEQQKLAEINLKKNQIVGFVTSDWIKQPNVYIFAVEWVETNKSVDHNANEYLKDCLMKFFGKNIYGKYVKCFDSQTMLDELLKTANEQGYSVDGSIIGISSFEACELLEFVSQSTLNIFDRCVFDQPESNPPESNPPESNPSESDPSVSDQSTSDSSLSDPSTLDPSASDPSASDPSASYPSMTEQQMGKSKSSPVARMYELSDVLNKKNEPFKVVSVFDKKNIDLKEFNKLMDEDIFF
jgi:hypothetical protein